MRVIESVLNNLRRICFSLTAAHLTNFQLENFVSSVYQMQSKILPDLDRVLLVKYKGVGWHAS